MVGASSCIFGRVVVVVVVVVVDEFGTVAPGLFLNSGDGRLLLSREEWRAFFRASSSLAFLMKFSLRMAALDL
ncbi:hypothetical protein IWZ03DRAFT_381318 [Phyllosticta citriasiana]|uniref:Secreted protein n=1 Tax=Phyllosticta citriasiana TaxID=595635 RepID=A0ABR1KGV3_9PEZI